MLRCGAGASSAACRALLAGGRNAMVESRRLVPLLHAKDAATHYYDEVGHPIHKRPRWNDYGEPFDGVPLASGNHIYVHGIAATPTPLLRGLCETVVKRDLDNITLHHMHLEGDVPWITKPYASRIRSNSLFTGANLRKAVNDGRADAVAIFLSQGPYLFRNRTYNIDVALIHVSPPDKRGFCSLGTSVDMTRSAIVNARRIIALCNVNMPRTFGDATVHSSHIDVLVHTDMQLYERHFAPATDSDRLIGKLIADNLVEDGATLQSGIGAIPDAALSALTGHKDLGVHSEMFSDGVLDLVQCGAITNARKKVLPGKLVSSFIYGSTRLYEFIHDNPMLVMGNLSWVNDTAVIRQNASVTAINSAVEVDLTGQVVADSVGSRIISGFGGQVDFIRGAALCEDGRGKPIIALPSTAKKGQSKIVPVIQDAAGVVTTRAHVNYVVTEHGIASLFGKTMRQRAYELIRIAAPNCREELEKAAFDRLKCMPAPH